MTFFLGLSEREFNEWINTWRWCGVIASDGAIWSILNWEAEVAGQRSRRRGQCGHYTALRIPRGGQAGQALSSELLATPRWPRSPKHATNHQIGSPVAASSHPLQSVKLSPIISPHFIGHLFSFILPINPHAHIPFSTRNVTWDCHDWCHLVDINTPRENHSFAPPLGIKACSDCFNIRCHSWLGCPFFFCIFYPFLRYRYSLFFSTCRFS